MSVDFNYISKKKKNILICRALIPLMINESIYVWVVYKGNGGGLLRTYIVVTFLSNGMGKLLSELNTIPF